MASRLRAPANDEDRIASLEAENAKLRKINAALMDRVERSTDLQGNAFSLFETAISLEGKVRERTLDLEQALDALAGSNAALGTARDKADEAQRRLRDAIESINEGFAIFDADDRLVLCNQTYLGLWPNIAHRIKPGITFDELARAIGDDGTTLGALVAPDRWVSERVAQHRVAEGGHVHALADGRWIQINELRTSEGGIVGVYTDITQVKADDARERTREMAEKTAILQATLDNIRLGVCVYDAERRLIAWNGPLLSTIGLPDDGLPLVTTHDALVKTCVQLNGAMERNRPLDWLPPGSPDVVAQRRHKSGRTVEVRRSSMADGGMVMSFEDITGRLAAAEALRETNETLEARVEERTSLLQNEVRERLSAEEAMREAKTAAEQANISKTRFLAAASHDLLQPLNAARLFVAALGDRRLALPTRALVRQTGSALDSVEDLLEALLEISRLDAGAIVAEPVDFALDELLDSMKAEFAAVARERGLAFAVQPSGQWVRSDPRLLRRILQNLIANALRYTEAGEVIVSSALHGDALTIAVKDTGIGIAPEDHARVFEEFQRVGESGGDRGIGLGLAIVQRAGRMLDHPIRLESTPGRGSTFSVTVPLGVPSVGRPVGSEPAERGGLSGKSVLVIDNDVAILDGMTAILSGWGCSIATSTGMPVLSDNAPPDVIVADYHLDDGLTGDAVVAGIRAVYRADVPAIIITADRTPELRDALSGQGLHVLTKPVKPAQLRALLTRLAR
jgi:signal transduction histidine kinase/PAS domain-containing protein